MFLNFSRITLTILFLQQKNNSVGNLALESNVLSHSATVADLYDIGSKKPILKNVSVPHALKLLPVTRRIKSSSHESLVAAWLVRDRKRATAGLVKAPVGNQFKCHSKPKSISTCMSTRFDTNYLISQNKCFVQVARTPGYLQDAKSIEELLEERNVFYSSPKFLEECNIYPLEAFEDFTLGLRLPKEWGDLCTNEMGDPTPISAKALWFPSGGASADAES